MPPDLPALTCLLTNLLAGRPPALPPHQLSPKSMHWLLRQLEKRGAAGAATSLLWSLPQACRTAPIVTRVMQVCLGQGSDAGPNEVLKLWRQLRAEGMQADATCFNTVITAAGGFVVGAATATGDWHAGHCGADTWRVTHRSQCSASRRAIWDAVERGQLPSRVSSSAGPLPNLPSTNLRPGPALEHGALGVGGHATRGRGTRRLHLCGRAFQLPRRPARAALVRRHGVAW